MIRYALKCDNAHGFESWFQSASAFDALCTAGHVSCPQCGSLKVSKALMAPNLRPGDQEMAEPLPPPPRDAALREPDSDLARRLAELREAIESNSDYVGLNFAAEARAMHDGDKPLRSIYGEARADDAKRLLEDGVPVAPLPFMPKARVN